MNTNKEVDGAPGREDVQAILDAIAFRNELSRSLEAQAGLIPDLRRADLRNMVISGGDLFPIGLARANLSHAYLAGSNLSRTYLREARMVETNLFRVTLTGASLQGAKLLQVNFHRATLLDADLTAADLTDSYNLPQAVLDEARARPGYPPTLAGTIDPETGEPLVWRGKALDGDD